VRPQVYPTLGMSKERVVERGGTSSRDRAVVGAAGEHFFHRHHLSFDSNYFERIQTSSRYISDVTAQSFVKRMTSTDDMAIKPSSTVRSSKGMNWLSSPDGR